MNMPFNVGLILDYVKEIKHSILRIREMLEDVHAYVEKQNMNVDLSEREGDDR